ncbi:YchJ family metal-binding protein [Mycolicibacterium aubagnense]
MEYAACCGPLHRGERPAATALALMRSRFTAFALGEVDYLLATWHPTTRPADLDLDADVVWRRLQIVDTEAGGEDDATGVVQFRAQYVRAGGRHILHERSRFARSRDGRWLYVDGDFVD